MDFPIFFIDTMGNRMLIAVIAVTHVLINHPMAVGGYPVIVLLEWWGRRTGNPAWDDLAHRAVRVLFIITTSVGALTGVGIWLATSLVAPFGIGSLLRVFFWAWFTEWIVFVLEVVLVLIYYLTWKRWQTGTQKTLHFATGIALAVCSWITMALITAILGFMMDSGSWTDTGRFFSALLNPLYLPQLAFRTAYAMVTGGLFLWFLMFFFTKKRSEFRPKAMRLVAIWTLLWVPLWLAAGAWYWHRVPDTMQINANVGLLTQRFMQWHDGFAYLIATAIGVVLIVVLAGAVVPRRIPRVALLVPFVLCVWLLGHFERVREFVRKPYVIADYMYANGVRVDELAVFQQNGILPYATYANYQTVTPQNRVRAGQDVFMLACTRCHTTTGINGIINKFETLYGTGAWDEDAMRAFIPTMHNTRTFMPPFPGNEAEADALVAFLQALHQSPHTLPGAQTAGVPSPVPIKASNSIWVPYTILPTTSP